MAAISPLEIRSSGMRSTFGTKLASGLYCRTDSVSRSKRISPVKGKCVRPTRKFQNRQKVPSDQAVWVVQGALQINSLSVKSTRIEQGQACAVHVCARTRTVQTNAVPRKDYAGHAGMRATACGNVAWQSLSHLTRVPSPRSSAAVLFNGSIAMLRQKQRTSQADPLDPDLD
eukprot:208497-Pleurochrysis_carterae.AAC.2